ncbi:MAG: hypothetical protein NVS3B2_15530 [Ramlibacter sp.]
MLKRTVPVALLLTLCAHWQPAQAQPVYRCGGSYGNQPCPGGVVVPTDDPRSAAQRAQTDAATKRDAQSAQAMEKERLRQEAVPAQATIPAAAPQPVASDQDKIVARARVKKEKSRVRPKSSGPELINAVETKKPREATTPARQNAAKRKAAKKAAA